MISPSGILRALYRVQGNPCAGRTMEERGREEKSEQEKRNDHKRCVVLVTRMAIEQVGFDQKFIRERCSSRDRNYYLIHFTSDIKDVKARFAFFIFAI